MNPTALSFLLRGDALGAIKYIDSLDRCEDIENLAELRRKLVSRFTKQTEDLKSETVTFSPHFDSIRSAFQAYWREVMTNPSGCVAAESTLLLGLQKVSNSEFSSNFEDVCNSLQSLLAEEGIISLFGTVAPFKSFMAWRKSTISVFEVETLSGSVNLSVNLLDNFLEKSWLAFATFDEKYVGGWENEHGVFAVLPAWKGGIDGEPFTISLLKHEGQHKTDRELFPWMESIQLEYRAKLNEIAFSSNPIDKLHDFISQAENDQNYPHSYAAWRIGRRFECSLDSKKIIETCKVAFEESSRKGWINLC
jgi:hypothetical protein